MILKFSSILAFLLISFFSFGQKINFAISLDYPNEFIELKDSDGQEFIYEDGHGARVSLKSEQFNESFNLDNKAAFALLKIAIELDSFELVYEKKEFQINNITDAAYFSYLYFADNRYYNRDEIYFKYDSFMFIVYFESPLDKYDDYDVTFTEMIESLMIETK
jgi:hypothetical protein